MKPNTDSSWITQNDNGVTIRLQIQPKASKSEWVGVLGEPPRLKIRIAAPPVDGEANEELLRFLKKNFRGLCQGVELVRGETSKMKDVLCRGAILKEIKDIITSR